MENPGDVMKRTLVAIVLVLVALVPSRALARGRAATRGDGLTSRDGALTSRAGTGTLAGMSAVRRALELLLT